uniref:homocysteine S-methyltransferase family protein n=1 Tax=Mycobacteroides abscessus TaxID=36809 RepID=UPI0018E46495
MIQTGLLEKLKNQVLIGDGAMGTLLHRYGIPVGTCGEELNLTRPDVVKDIHLRYIQAGANLIETNTFGANREKLSKFGLEDQVKEINQAAVKIAREAAGDSAFVVGAVGGILGGRRRNVPAGELKEAFEEQIQSLVEAGVDGLILETFCFVDEALIALGIAKQYAPLPVICQLTIQDVDRTQDGYSLESAFGLLVEAGAHVV